MIIADDKMIVVGGVDKLSCFNDVFVYNFERSKWKKEKNKGEIEEIFPKRYFHSVCVYENSLVIFGGKNIDNYLFNDLIYYKFGIFVLFIFIF